MTASTWVDVVLVVVALIAALSGWRQGAVASVLAFFGVLVGAVAGILVAPHLLVHIDDSRLRILADIALIVVLVVIGEVAGMVLGRAARGGMHSPAARGVDSIIGAGVQAVAVFVAAWLLAIPLTSSSQPQIASALRGSTVLAEVDALAPDWLRALPSEFSALLDTSGLPEVIGPFGRTPVVTVDPPDASVLASPVASSLQSSVLKIQGVAPSCQRALEGSGFVFAPGRVMTNAHVVAGTDGVTVASPDGTLPGEVVLFDPVRDIAVLDVPGLTAAPVPISPDLAASGDDAIVLGYPGGGPYTASAARVREVLDLTGPDIYREGSVQREVYTVRGEIRQGNSGGPLVSPDGEVVGLVFGAAVDDAETGFVLTTREIASAVEAGGGAVAPAPTGACAA
ncbi:serine protease [Rhodococcus rhodnii]|uniref:Protease n=2 Tax=Rhodococcus rhodnii TaxID=38312 RepID=R7WIP8_9NOCA|nr:MarP family serine protease [Rhodococcus rhodnii]EOM75086.1 protease [Rhodococcus rhodnii LMG 5362]TXG89320.1 serine protease [Rhodococcus rhodnii]